MSLLSEIEESLTRSDRPLADILRKAKILAVRLGSDELERWVDSELNGYNSEDDLPSYRVMSVMAKGRLLGPWQSGYDNFPIPSLALPENFRELATEHRAMGGVASIEATLEMFGPSENIAFAWDPNAVLILQDKIVRGMRLVQAWSEISRDSYVAILDSVRNRLLAFVLAIEKENPQAGEPGIVSPVSPEKVQQIFNTHVYHSTGNIAIGSSDFEQYARAVPKGDFESLKRTLLEVGLSEDDIQDLRAALDQDGEPGQGFGEQLSAWIGKMIGKASSGSWQVSLAAAGQILGTAVGQFLGLPSGQS